jgi:hypothetical protein
MCTLHEDKRETAAYVLVQALAMELAQYCDPRSISIGMIVDRGVAVPVCTDWTAFFEGTQVTSGRKLLNQEPQFTLTFDLIDGEWLLIKPAMNWAIRHGYALPFSPTTSDTRFAQLSDRIVPVAVNQPA